MRRDQRVPTYKNVQETSLFPPLLMAGHKLHVCFVSSSSLGPGFKPYLGLVDNKAHHASAVDLSLVLNIKPYVKKVGSKYIHKIFKYIQVFRWLYYKSLHAATCISTFKDPFQTKQKKRDHLLNCPCVVYEVIQWIVSNSNKKLKTEGIVSERSLVCYDIEI